MVIENYLKFNKRVPTAEKERSKIQPALEVQHLPCTSSDLITASTLSKFMVSPIDIPK